MTVEQKQFLELVKSHLNNEVPSIPGKINYSGLFKVSEIQDMTAITAVELKKLSAPQKPDKAEFSPFNQVLGLTLQRYEFKMNGINLLKETFDSAEIKHLFLKGAAIRDLYPVPELRTSGDTDIVVSPEDFKRASSLLRDCGFTLKQHTDNEDVFFYNGEEFELKSYIDFLNGNVKDYFRDTFNESIAVNNSGSTYLLNPLNHLIYVTSHMLRHFKAGGAGVRQLVDIDLLIRNCDIDINEFFRITEKLNFEKSAKVLVALSKKYFNTPVDFEYEIDDKLYNSLEDVILNGGTFGYGIGNIGTSRLLTTINTSGDNSRIASVKAVLGLFKFNKEFLYHNYEYARNHPVLLPAAYLSRLYDAVFKRGKSNIRHIKSMFTDREIATKMSEMLKELEIV